ncbi:two-component system alkaline phosphatase synthesis response regulator PhoP [Fontibacillus phaseoli]|uniref:Two-component system alkaline phosphatase synthesis response regulator PhoP n=1 Tax=Fontibacillus phaseoli TaxID=1416533 RepID=A0A369BF09_9BACL|nr:winged helix-turn-helix domain-containing protein [Fontibacillus phaseoli]RCX19188.1 two-component system alkaline phosphatase synthesis response regulator PhoP [Fontibacillus phaseoli]
MSAEEVKTLGRMQTGTMTPFRRPEEAGGSSSETLDLFDGREVCPVTQRVILVSPYPGGIHELVRDLSEGCFDVLVFHHWEQGIRNAQTADLLIFDLTPFQDAEEVAPVKSLVLEAGNVPSLLLVNERLLPKLDQGLMNQELLVWPARPGEINYHAQRIIRSGAQRSPASRLLTGTSPAIFKDLWIDRKKMSVYRNGAKIALTKTEYELLVKLLEREGTVLSREDLLAEIWGTSFLGGSNIVDVHIKSLRKKLGDRAVNSMYIATVRGVGYRLAD